MNGMKDHDAFQYTSGRWLFNEAQRLQERSLKFDIPALVEAATSSVGRSMNDVQSLTKLAEGGFNRVFKLSMHDGFQMIARLPYPLTGPKSLAVASEVATIDFIRSHGVPVPRIYGYSCHADNAVGSEYILMEYMPGQRLGETWFTLSPKDRIKVLSGIVDIEAKLFTIAFPAYGCLFYDDDLPSQMQRHPLPSKNSGRRFCVGPDVTLKFWFEEREGLKITRGPSQSAADVLLSAANKELVWLRAHGRARYPFDRVYRDLTNFEKSSPKDHEENLKKFSQIAPLLVPKEDWLSRPTLRHPDLNPNNIFISSSLQITGIIDWQHSNVLPLFLNAGIPSQFQNYGDPDSENLVKPDYPDYLEELDEEDREKDLELYRKRHVHFFYVGATASKLSVHFDALTHDGEMYLRRLYQYASEPWEGNNIPLAALLAQLHEVWPILTTGTDKADTPCPLLVNEQQDSDMMEKLSKQEEADHQMTILRNVLGIGTDGWVSTQDFEQAVAQAAEFKKQAIASADDDHEREMTIRHWPFDNHDESE